MEERTIYIIPVKEKKTTEEESMMIRHLKAMYSEELEISDDDIEFYIIRK